MLCVPSNSVVKIERWDLQLLCFFIKYVCSSDESICDDINALKDIRNHVCHTAKGMINGADYQRKRNEIRRINSNFLGIIGNATLTEKIECEIAEIDNGTRDITDALDTLREWLDSEKHQRTPMHNISDVHREILDRLLTAQGSQPVPDAEIDLVVEIPDNIQLQDKVSQTLVNMLDPRLRSDPELGDLTETQFRGIQNKVTECMEHLLESGQLVVRATPGCVIITVRSNTFVSLERLWRKLFRAEMETNMAPLQEVLRKTFSERLTIKAVLPECSFLEVAEKLVHQIQTSDKKGSYRRPQRHTHVPGNVEGMEKPNSQSVINMKIKTKSLKDYERLHPHLSESNLKTTFERVTDVLKEELKTPDVRISANLVRKKIITGVQVRSTPPPIPDLQVMENIGNTDVDEGWEKIRQARQLQELFHGRFTQQDSINLLKHNNWDIAATLDFTLTATTGELRKVLGVNLHNVKAATTDDVLRNFDIRTEVRQFACGPCDNMWWSRVPVRKMVSRCKKCQMKTDALPRDREWGWATFNCPCGNEFRGFGAMGKTRSACYECREHCSPVRIESPDRRHGRRGNSKRTHSCTASNCFNKSEPGSSGLIVDWCVHPKSLVRQVVEPSTSHVSTSSTVDTFLSQNDCMSTDSQYGSSLSSIDEASCQ